MMDTKNGLQITNDDIGKGCYAALDRIYVSMKLWHKYITKEDVDAIIGCWEKFLLSYDEEDLLAIEKIKRSGDISGIMGDID